MPFTPFHMGPGILIKSILQGSFSLMIFGWSQIIMDIQPLIVLITGEGHLHGFSHTYIGATLIAIFSGLSGKHLSQWALEQLKIPSLQQLNIAWWVVFLSAFIGSYSHIFLDAMMHMDVQPFYPWFLDNKFLGLLSISGIHKLCFYTGLIGAIIYFAVNWKIYKQQLKD